MKLFASTRKANCTDTTPNKVQCAWHNQGSPAASRHNTSPRNEGDKCYMLQHTHGVLPETQQTHITRHLTMLTHVPAAAAAGTVAGAVCRFISACLPLQEGAHPCASSVADHHHCLPQHDACHPCKATANDSNKFSTRHTTLLQSTSHYNSLLNQQDKHVNHQPTDPTRQIQSCCLSNNKPAAMSKHHCILWLGGAPTTHGTADTHAPPPRPLCLPLQFLS